MPSPHSTRILYTETHTIMIWLTAPEQPVTYLRDTTVSRNIYSQTLKCYRLNNTRQTGHCSRSLLNSQHFPYNRARVDSLPFTNLMKGVTKYSRSVGSN